MAYTSVIPVRRLDRTVDYVQNKRKKRHRNHWKKLWTMRQTGIKPNQLF